MSTKKSRSKSKENPSAEKAKALGKKMAVGSLMLPYVTDLDMAFSTQDVDRDMLAEAEKLYKEGKLRKYTDMFSTLFFQGGVIVKSDEITEEQFVHGRRYLKALMSSFNPKHEHKEVVSGLILSQLAKEIKPIPKKDTK